MNSNIYASPGAKWVGFYGNSGNREVMRHFPFHGSWKNLEYNLRALYKDRITTGPGKSLANKNLWMPRGKTYAGQYECVLQPHSSQEGLQRERGHWRLLASEAKLVWWKENRELKTSSRGLWVVRQNACCSTFSLQNLRLSHLPTCRTASNNRTVAPMSLQGKMTIQIKEPNSLRKEIKQIRCSTKTSEGNR